MEWIICNMNKIWKKLKKLLKWIHYIAKNCFLAISAIYLCALVLCWAHNDLNMRIFCNFFYAPSQSWTLGAAIAWHLHPPSQTPAATSTQFWAIFTHIMSVINQLVRREVFHFGGLLRLEQWGGGGDHRRAAFVTGAIFHAFLRSNYKDAAVPVHPRATDACPPSSPPTALGHQRDVRQSPSLKGKTRWLHGMLFQMRAREREREMTFWLRVAWQTSYVAFETVGSSKANSSQT